MDLDLKSKTAVVSGASTGIGRATAKALALEGVRVIAVARRKDLLDQLVQWLELHQRSVVRQDPRRSFASNVREYGGGPENSVDMRRHDRCY